MAGLCFAGFEGFDCSIAWGLMVILFFIGAILRRQLADLLDMNFNVIGSTVLGVLAFFITSFISHSFKISFVVGLVGVLIGGFVVGMFLENE